MVRELSGPVRVNAYRASIVIPTYRRRASLERLLVALTQQTIPPGEFEVIVSIDGSEDGTREMVRAFFAPYRLSALWQANAGRARACNSGVRAACGEFVVLLDDDMEPPPGFLAAHLAAHHRGQEVCVIGAAPIRIHAATSPVERFLAWVYQQNMLRMSQPGYRPEMRDFYSGNMSIRREALLRVGLYDEDFLEYGSEDRELFLRIARAAIPIVYSVEALAYQHYEKDFAALAKDRIAAGRTAVLLVRKHPETYQAILGSKYRQCSRRWRYFRKLLLTVSRFWKGLPALILSSVESLVRLWPATFPVFGPAVLDYVFWVSAFAALHDELPRRNSPSDMCMDSGRSPRPPASRL